MFNQQCKNKVSLPMLIIAICAAALLAVYCTSVDFNNPVDPKIPYTLTTNAGTGGSVTRNPDQTTYSWGTRVTVTANADIGYRFTGWSGASTSGGASVIIIMDGNKTLTANFELRTYTLTVTPTEGGSVTRDPRQNNYNHGTSVTVTATANDGYLFTGWSGASTSTEPEVTITMDENKTLTANFVALPRTPTGVTASAASPNSITVSWSAVSGATGYRVYRSTSSNGSYTLVGSPTTNSYTDTELTASTTYYYQVTAYNNVGESANSSTVNAATPSDTGVPSAPTGVTATAVSSSGITVDWTAVSGATGYYIYRSTSSNGTYAQVGSSITSTSFTDAGLSSNTTYYYRVAAYNSAGTGTQSSTASATTQTSGGNINYGTLTDSRDGKTYKTVTIGTQTWMAENLNYNLDSGNSWCYGNSADNCAKYGRLYDWNTAMGGASSSSANPSGVQGVCPSGWHLPSDAEWGILIATVGGSSTAGRSLKSTSGWFNNGNGTDNYGFSALPGGHYSSGSFSNTERIGYWWTATEYDATDARYRYMDYFNEDVYSSWSDEFSGFSVRCLMD